MAFGALLGQSASGGGGKRVCRFTVGTSTAGWTANDCDYLCDGTDDQVEINAAIQALPAGGGEIIILDGTYNITATIAMNKNNVTLSGNGSSTVLKRMWKSSSKEGVVTVTATNGGCCVASLQVDGNKSVYNSSNNYGIYLYNGSNNNTITGNTCIRGTGTSSDYTSSQYTIQAGSDSSNNLIVGNNIMGKNYVDSGTNNTWANNKYN